MLIYRLAIKLIGDAIMQTFQQLYTEAFNNMFKLVDSELSEPKSYVAADEVIDTEESFVVNLEVPGVSIEDISVKVENSKLIVSGDKKSTSENVLSSNRKFKKFKNVYSLGNKVNVDGIEAKLKDGVLSLSLPKSKEAQPKTIEIKLG